MTSLTNEEMSPLEIARLRYDMGGVCPEKGRSHDGVPCCICGKTIRDDKRDALTALDKTP